MTVSIFRQASTKGNMWYTLLCWSALSILHFDYFSTNDLHPRRNKPCPSPGRWLIWCDWYLVLNATFSNISAMSWWPVLVVEEPGVPGENHRPWTRNWQTLSRVAASRVHHFVIYKAGREPTPFWYLPVDLMLYNHEAEFMQERIKESKSFNLTFTYIDDVLSMSYSDLASWMPLIYPLQSLR